MKGEVAGMKLICGWGGHARAALIHFAQGVLCICKGERSIGFKLASSIFFFLCLQFKGSLCSQACVGPAVMLTLAVGTP